MACTNCWTSSCYVCRKSITNNHDHFGTFGCVLYDSVEKRHKKEVRSHQHSHPPPPPTHQCAQVGEAQKKAIGKSEGSVKESVKEHFS